MAVSLPVRQQAGGGVSRARQSRRPQGHGCNADERGGEVEQHRPGPVGRVLLAAGCIDDERVVLTRQLVRPCEVKRRKEGTGSALVAPCLIPVLHHRPCLPTCLSRQTQSTVWEAEALHPVLTQGAVQPFHVAQLDGHPRLVLVARGRAVRGQEDQDGGGHCGSLEAHLGESRSTHTWCSPPDGTRGRQGGSRWGEEGWGSHTAWGQ